MLNLNRRVIPKGFWGFTIGIVTAFTIEYAYSLALFAIGLGFPKLLDLWNHGGVWERTAFALPLLGMVAAIAVLSYRRSRSFAMGLMSYVIVFGIWQAIFLVEFIWTNR